jgi:pimeloyl-ACP methyl ester carboxylesterase
MVVYEREQPPGSQFAPVDVVRYNCYHGSQRLPDGKLTYKYDRTTLAHFDQYDTRALLPQIECPTLVIRGEHSVVMRAEIAQDMSRLLPGGIFKEIPDAGHIVFVDNPSGFAQVAREFFNSL